LINKDNILLFFKNHKDEFREKYKIVALGIFGSFARDEQNEGSDIDLLVEFEDNTEELYEKKTEIKALLKAHFQREIDICRIKYIKPYFKQQILDTAIYA
jgi:uncharacterized protein